MIQSQQAHSPDQKSQQQQWTELLGFCQLLESIGLSEPALQLRHAEISLGLEDFSTARGGHYLVKVRLNNNAEVNLMIDQGERVLYLQERYVSGRQKMVVSSGLLVLL